MAAVQGEEAGSDLKLYVDMLSPPCRAVVIFCRANGEVIIHIPEGDTKTPEYLKINPLGKVPSIDDGGFKLNESHAILRYLATTRDVADPWYPKDAKRRAVIDNVLDWHHLNIRKNAEKVAAESEKLLKNILEQLETVFLQGPGKFLVNGEQLLDKKDVTDLFGPRKKITAWMDAVEEATNPHFSTVTSQVLSLNQ